MTSAPPPSRPVSAPSPPPGLGMVEFVLMMAAVMSATALSIDPMLPALPQIGHDLHVAVANDRQQIITIFFMGLSAGSLLFGPLSDHFGRRPVLLAALATMLLFTVLCALAPSFPVLLGARLSAGFFAAAGRVMVVSIVRDRFQGDQMARIMSLIMVIFMVVPILAPGYGTLVLMWAPWRWIFWLLAGLLAVELLWLGLRLPETLRDEARVAIRPRDLAAMLGRIVTQRSSIGYIVASGLMMSCMVGFLVSVQQIFFDVFHRPEMLPVGFAAIGLWTAVGSLANSRLVQRFGARRMSQSAVIALILLSAVHSLVGWAGLESLWLFVVIQGMMALFFSMGGANFSSIALEPFARGAGLASSVQASLTTLMSSVLGGLIGAHFDGSTLPLSLGFLAYGCATLLVILWAEKGRLFTRPGLNGAHGR